MGNIMVPKWDPKGGPKRTPLEYLFMGPKWTPKWEGIWCRYLVVH